MLRSIEAIAARISAFFLQSESQPVAASQAACAGQMAIGTLNIPVAQPGTDALIGHKTIERGRYLARQGLWSHLSAEMATADTAGDTTPCGQSITELLAFGARSDVVLAVEHALSDGKAITDYDLLCGISELESEMNDHPGDPMIALVVALAHIDLAWAWRGKTPEAKLPRLHRSRCAAHFDRASVILSECRELAKNSPAIAAGDCALLAGHRTANARAADKFETLISLDPHNHRHMRVMGAHLLPRFFGSYEKLENQALRMAAKTQAVWGAGGYTWVQFDAIAQDDEACARVDVDYFLDGLRDIVARRPDQETINLLAAYCAITLKNRMGRNEKADRARQRICDAADWLIRDHLTELHPLIWAHAANGFNNSLRVSSAERFAALGHRDALRAIGNLFREELRSGLNVTFTPSGLQLSSN
ncbi:MAG: hypothetical protein AB3N07_04565 [Ruegeria sp.]|uniref:hypothetical protein n=1 Tax=Ruegeria sp. ANG-S4 TaxID=1577904 RepID=UPI00057C9580|nr:hypothetical protein [Ruegeria sp. ANG-S4]KIC47040.1 hypothetical protein RA28_04850 [Ruegeria sp. ANG-S4]